MTERMSDELLSELRHDAWSRRGVGDAKVAADYEAMLAEIDRARAAEAELRAEVERVRDRLRAVVVAQADAWDAAIWRASGSGDRAIHNADWQAACGATEELGRELRGKP